MRPLSLNDILSIEEYEARRDELRRVAMKEKNRRRLAVGDSITFLFENFVTLQYQVQEMVRVERIRSKAGIRHEIATYNELIPGPGELTATMMIEYTDPEERKLALQKLVGLQDHTFLVIDDIRVAGVFDQRQYEGDRISSVQFVHFNIGGRSPEEFMRLADAGKIGIELDHPEMRVTAPIEEEVAEALVMDLEKSEQERGWEKEHKKTAEVAVDPAQFSSALTDVITAQLVSTNDSLETYKAMAGMIAEETQARDVIENLITLSRSHAEALVTILESLERRPEA